MDSTVMLLCGKRIVDTLRSETQLAYDSCTNSAALVIGTLLDLMDERSISSLDLRTLKRLQQAVVLSQNNLDEKDVRASWDYKQVVASMHELESYRKGSDNREVFVPFAPFLLPEAMMWQGGNWNRNDDSRNSPVKIVSSIHNIFGKANPLILREVVEYPGAGSVGEFQLVDVLIDELQWVLQSLEVPNLHSASKCANEICSLLFKSAVLHPKIVDVLCSSTTLRSVIFRLLNQLDSLEERVTASWKVVRSRSSDQIDALPLIRLATLVLSAASRDLTWLDEMKNEDSVEAVFPELDRSVSLLLRRSLLGDAELSFQQQMVAFWISLTSFQLERLTIDDRRDRPFTFHGYLNLQEKSSSSSTQAAILHVLERTVETAIDWWNHELQCSVLDGSDPEKDFGLAESIPLTARFLAYLVTLKYEAPGFDETIAFFAIDPEKHSSDPRTASDSSSIFVVSQSSCDVLKAICERIMTDHAPQDTMYEKSEELLHVIMTSRCV